MHRIIASETATGAGGKANAFLRYVTDNPYRLLGISSSTSRVQLRQKADAVAQATKVGLSPRGALDASFGSDETPNCPSIVRSIGNDPRRRTVYRLFWPLEYTSPDNASGTVADLESLVEQAESFHCTHLRFLIGWYRFESGAEAASLGLALTSFQELYACEECDDYLLDLLVSDGDSTGDTDVIYEAQNEVMRHVVSSALGRAVDLWNAGDMSSAVDIVEVLVGTYRYDDDLLSRAMVERIAPLGDEEARRARSLAVGSEERVQETEDEDIEGLVHSLDRLATAIGPYLARAREWSEAAEDLRIAGDSEGLAFEVSVSGPHVYVPPVCTCCLAPTESIRTVTRTWTEQRVVGSTRHTLSLDLPLCEECRWHIDATWGKAGLLLACALAPAFILTWMGARMFTDMGGLVCAGSGGGISLLFAWALSNCIRTATLPFRHAGREMPAWIQRRHDSEEENLVSLVFMNAGYARRFAQANRGEVSAVWHRPWFGRGTRVWSTRLAIVCVLIAMVGSGIVFGTVTSGSDQYRSPYGHAESALAEKGSAVDEDDSGKAGGLAAGSQHDQAREERVRRLQNERRTLDREASTVNDEISASKTGIEYEKEVLRQSGQQIDLDRPTVNRYDSRAVARFNLEVKQHNQKARLLEDRIQRHNRNVKRIRHLAGRLQQIERALDEMGESYE